MNNSNTGQQLRYLEEISISLHRAGFETKPPEDCQLPILWNDAPLCRITGKGSVFYRRADADTPQAEDALYRVEDIAAKTLEYMTAMEAAPQLKASGLDGDYRILADFGGTVLAGSPSKYGVQFVTWDWDYAHDGFGCSPHTIGRSVRCTCLGDGEMTRWSRHEFIGVLDEKYLPDWAREKLMELTAPRQEAPATGEMKLE